MAKSWFEVDKEGLAKILERRGKSFVLFELLSNAWDADSSNVAVSLTRRGRSRLVDLVVEDDDPNGFENLTHAFTLFSESGKKSDPSKRGRFNIGEKLSIALCVSATIETVRGTVVFTREGRTETRRKRERGSAFRGVLPMSDKEMQDCLAACQLLLPPEGVRTTVNGAALVERVPVLFFTDTLATEYAGDDGVLRRTRRQCEIRIYTPLPGETPSLYELGIPVVATNDFYHVDIRQKVPVTLDRDNVSPPYLREVRRVVLEMTAPLLDAETVSASWVRDALADPSCPVETVKSVVEKQFGTKVVAYDPSDSEANKLSVARGFTVVHGAQFNREKWPPSGARARCAQPVR